MLRLYVWLDDRLRDLLRREEGQDMIEYALIASVVSILVVLAVSGILEDSFEKWAKKVRNAIKKEYD